jgi:molecular chaperone HscB
VDHFARFGLPRQYGVDRKALEQAYQRLSFQHHPDLVAAAPPDERQRAQQAAADLNEGYRTLSSDAERAAYLLALLARDLLPPGAKLNAEALPKGFLQEMFLLQERVDELGEDDQEALAPLRHQVEAEHTQTLTERARLFAQPADAAALQAIQSNLNQEKYLLRLLDRLNGKNPGATL